MGFRRIRVSGNELLQGFRGFSRLPRLGICECQSHSKRHDLFGGGRLRDGFLQQCNGCRRVPLRYQNLCEINRSAREIRVDLEDRIEFGGGRR